MDDKDESSRCIFLATGREVMEQVYETTIQAVMAAHEQRVKDWQEEYKAFINDLVEKHGLSREAGVKYVLNPVEHALDIYIQKKDEQQS